MIPRSPGRTRLALLLISPAVLVVVIAVVVSLVVLSHLDATDVGNAEAGLARVGNDLALVIVTDGVDGEGTRSLVLNWGLVAPVLALLPATGVAWLMAVRVQHTVDRASAEVERADDERQRHLQEVVHELRTPLAVMGTNLELAADEAEGGARKGYIDAARRAVDRLARTVDDLAGHGQLAIQGEGGPVDMASLVHAAATEHAGPGNARGVHVVVTGSAPTHVPGVDPAAVRTAISNFLGNAVRLAPSGSAVTVDWGEVGEWAWIAVGDEGPGLAPSQHALVFERGWRGRHDRDRMSDGQAGLGLTIARQLTEAQGGAVTLVSEEGGGTTFTAWLPLEPEADRDTIVAPDRIHPRIHPWQRTTVGS